MKTPYREALLSKFKFNKGLKSNRTKEEEEILTEWKAFLIPAFTGITIMTIGFFLAFQLLFLRWDVGSNRHNRIREALSPE